MPGRGWGWRAGDSAPGVEVTAGRTLSDARSSRLGRGGRRCGGGVCWCSCRPWGRRASGRPAPIRTLHMPVAQSSRNSGRAVTTPVWVSAHLSPWPLHPLHSPPQLLGAQTPPALTWRVNKFLAVWGCPWAPVLQPHVAGLCHLCLVCPVQSLAWRPDHDKKQGEATRET